MSIVAGALQALPLYVEALPATSTATQNEVVGHDTDVRSVPLSIKVGGDQLAAEAAAGTAKKTNAARNARRRQLGPRPFIRPWFLRLAMPIPSGRGSEDWIVA